MILKGLQIVLVTILGGDQLLIGAKFGLKGHSSTLHSVLQLARLQSRVGVSWRSLFVCKPVGLCVVWAAYAALGGPLIGS